MKTWAAVLFCCLPLTMAMDLTTMGHVTYFVEQLAGLFQGFDNSNMMKHFDVEKREVKANLVYGPMENILRGMIADKAYVEIDEINNSTSPLYIRDAVVLGVNNTYLSIDAPSFGYDITNLTVQIPYIDISAEEYTLNGFDLGLVKLNGKGPLHVELVGLKLYAKMGIKRLNKKFVVKTISALEFDIQNSLFQVENLGAACEEMSDFLNAIATHGLPSVVNYMNRNLKNAVGVAGGDCSKGLDLMCDLISLFINELVDKFLP